MQSLDFTMISRIIKYSKMLLQLRSSIFVFILLPIFANANTAPLAKFDFNENCKTAYQQIISLKIKSAEATIAAEKKSNPTNPVIAYLDHAHDFMIFFVEEYETDYEALNKNFNKRYSIIESADDKSPWRKYLLAQMDIEMCIANGKMGNYVSSVLESRRANILLTENDKKNPTFTPNKKGLGLIHCLIGTIPEKYKWGASLFGFSGNLNEGMNELVEVKTYVDKTKFYCEPELNFIYVYGLLYMTNDKANAYKLSQQFLKENPENLLYHFLAANVAQATAHNDEAINILLKKPNSAEYLHFDYMDYMLGLSYLRKLDPAASTWFEKFALANKRRNFVKEGYQKLAWSYLIVGDNINYKKAKQNCKQLGNTTVDADKQALRELEAQENPNVLLLKARLLCDGGYYEKGINLLAGHKMADFKLKREQAEFVYRVGRIYHEWGYVDKAIPFYIEAYQQGKEIPQHFSCNSALNLGIIYEQKGNKELAEKYYLLCISSKNSDFKNGLEQKARAGLQRIKK
jgi:Tetratricopeptide repeat